MYRSLQRWLKLKKEIVKLCQMRLICIEEIPFDARIPGKQL